MQIQIQAQLRFNRMCPWKQQESHHLGHRCSKDCVMGDICKISHMKMHAGQTPHRDQGLFSPLCFILQRSLDSTQTGASEGDVEIGFPAPSSPGGCRGQRLGSSPLDDQGHCNADCLDTEVFLPRSWLTAISGGRNGVILYSLDQI